MANILQNLAGVPTQGGETIKRRLTDIGGGAHAETVAIAGVDGDVVLTGDVLVNTLGALDDPAEQDPDAASATIPSLLRGVLAQQAALLAVLGTDSDTAGDPTVIGLLKQIAANTTPVA
jgi:hypothetical protein